MDDEKLDKPQIVREALSLLREDGIDKLSMRKLAARLGIRAPTLYWYFPDRSSILRDVIKALMAESIERVPGCQTWQEWMRNFGLSLWKTNQDAPYVALLLQSAELNDASVVDLALSLLEKVRERFNADERAFYGAHSDIQSLILGWAVFYHAHVTDRLVMRIDVDESVLNGIDVFVSHWAGKVGQTSEALAR